MGAGFDTSFFQIESENLLKEKDKFYEVDFPAVIERKIEYIRSSEELKALYNENIPESERKLVMIGNDLSELEELKKKFSEKKLNHEKNTLILSECVLTYMYEETSSNIIQWFSNNFKNSMFVMYEQTYPYDGFGEVMVSHFRKIGSPLRCIHQFPTIEDYKNRFLSLNWEKVDVVNMNDYFYRILPEYERSRVRSLEPFDEFQEWHLQCFHYFVLIAQNNTNHTYSDYFNSAADQIHPNPYSYANSLLSKFPLSPVNQLFNYFYQPVLGNENKIQLQRWGHSSCLLGDFMYVFGGFGGFKHSRLQDFYSINKKTLQITPILPEVGNKQTPSARIYATLTSCPASDASASPNDKVILFGGRAGTSDPFNDLFEFHISSNTWIKPATSIADPVSEPPPRWKHAALFVPSLNLFLVSGGKNYKQSLSPTPYVLELSNYSWNYATLTPSDPVPPPRHSHSFTLLDSSRILLLGGLNDDELPLHDTWIFHFSPDFHACRWESINVQFPFPIYSHNAILLPSPLPLDSENEEIKQGNVLVTSGVSTTLFPNNHWCFLFNLDTLSWYKLDLPNCPSGSFQIQQTSHFDSGILYLIGGGGTCFSFGSRFNHFLSIFTSKSIFKQHISDSNTNKIAMQAIPATDSHSKPSKQTKQQKPSDKNLLKSIKPPKKREEIEIISGESITAEEFLKIGERRRPVIIRGNALGEAMEKWSSIYLKEQCGEKLVSVDKSGERYFDFTKKNFTLGTMKFQEFIENTLEQDKNAKIHYYLRSLGNNPGKDKSDLWQDFPEIMKDFTLPEWFTKNFNFQKYSSSELRVSSKNTQLWTHYDMMDNIMCHVSGKKVVTFWDPKLASRMYLQGSSSSVIHIDTAEYTNFPDFPWSESIRCTLLPGDILFIPSLWFHNVYSKEASVSLNIFWKHLSNEFYCKGDLFGNNDLIIGSDILQHSSSIESSLSQLPEYYRDFYARLVIGAMNKYVSSSS